MAYKIAERVLAAIGLLSVLIVANIAVNGAVGSVTVTINDRAFCIGACEGYRP